MCIRDRKSIDSEEQLTLSQINPLESFALTDIDKASVKESIDFDLSMSKANTNRIADGLENTNMSSPVIGPLKNKEPQPEEIKHKVVASQQSENLSITDEDFTPEIIEEAKNLVNPQLKDSLKSSESSVIASVTEDIVAQEMPKTRTKLRVNELLCSIVGSHKLMQSLKEPLGSSKVASKTPSATFSSTGGFSLKFPPPPKTAGSARQKLVSKRRTRLFEEFFIISAPLDLVDKVKLIDFAYLPPSILYQYPNLPEHRNWYLLI
eukprot:TRINITY_DN14037_c0_g1_i1.p1 TRINITY_DN14037_c0_g1~~TRINITY_DN14037_c0_g1_i1.p1  ORF type:complete len:264 (+),score=56.16 TRINITY_DN14037_c0_g1_i1:73-864(+)